jgi:hypothetical protein
MIRQQLVQVVMNNLNSENLLTFFRSSQISAKRSSHQVDETIVSESQSLASENACQGRECLACNSITIMIDNKFNDSTVGEEGISGEVE